HGSGLEGLLDDARGLRVEAVADPEVGVDVAPPRRALLQLLAQLANEDVDRAIAMGHRVTPDPLVDRLALEHLAASGGEQLQELELAAGQVEALTGNEGLELIGPDLELGGDDGASFRLVATAAATPGNCFDPCHRLLGMAGLGNPVVDAEAQTTHP